MFICVYKLIIIFLIVIILFKCIKNASFSLVKLSHTLSNPTVAQTRIIWTFFPNPVFWTISNLSYRSDSFPTAIYVPEQPLHLYPKYPSLCPSQISFHSGTVGRLSQSYPCKSHWSQLWAPVFSSHIFFFVLTLEAT